MANYLGALQLKVDDITLNFSSKDFLNLFSYLGLALFITTLVTGQSQGMETEPYKFFKDCKVCPEMVKIPSGTFEMGSKIGKQNEKPVTKIHIDQPLAVGRFEVTFDEWDACHSEGGCSRKVHDRDWGRKNRPVINVLYSDIQEYLRWIKEKTNKLYRLPSEAEWEYAARAGTTTEYWWGDKMIKGYANCRDCGTKWSGIKSAPVGSFKPNPWGLYDLHGNLLEYVVDCWTNTHANVANNASPTLRPNCRSRVIKGGAWYYLPKASRSASRARNDTRVFSYFIGFRVVRGM